MGCCRGLYQSTRGERRHGEEEEFSVSERDPESPAEPRDATPPVDVPRHPLPPAHPGRHEHETCGEGTMKGMLNDALGRAARQIKIDPQTGLVLPCPTDRGEGEGDSGTEAAPSPPAVHHPDSAI